MNVGMSEPVVDDVVPDNCESAAGMPPTQPEIQANITDTSKDQGLLGEQPQDSAIEDRTTDSAAAVTAVDRAVLTAVTKDGTSDGDETNEQGASQDKDESDDDSAEFMDTSQGDATANGADFVMGSGHATHSNREEDAQEDSGEKGDDSNVDDVSSDEEFASDVDEAERESCGSPSSEAEDDESDEEEDEESNDDADSLDESVNTVPPNSAVLATRGPQKVNQGRTNAKEAAQSIAERRSRRTSGTGIDGSGKGGYSTNVQTDEDRLLGDRTYVHCLNDALGWESKVGLGFQEECIFFSEAREMNRLKEGVTEFYSRQAIGEVVKQNGDVQYHDRDGNTWYMLGKKIHLKALEYIGREPDEEEIDFLSMRPSAATRSRDTETYVASSRKRPATKKPKISKDLEAVVITPRATNPLSAKIGGMTRLKSIDGVEVRDISVLALREFVKQNDKCKITLSQTKKELANAIVRAKVECSESTTAAHIVPKRRQSSESNTVAQKRSKSVKPPPKSETRIASANEASGEQFIPYEARSLSEATKREMKKSLARAAWQMYKDESVADEMKEAAKSLINDIRDDSNGTTVWDDIETFTDKVPESPEAAREVVEALAHMFYT